MTPAEQTVNNILDLEQKLLAKHPEIPKLLATIHRQLKTDPEVVTILTPEQIKIVVSGLQHHTKVQLIAKVMGDGTKKKSLKSTSIDDI